MKIQTIVGILLVAMVSTKSVSRTKAHYKHNCKCQEKDVYQNFCYHWTCDQIISSSACFPPEALVKVHHPLNNTSTLKQLQHLQIGDLLLNSHNNHTFHDIFVGFLDKELQQPQQYLLFQLKHQKEFKVTNNHLIFIESKEESGFKYAKEARVGDYLRLVDERGEEKRQEIERIRNVVERGRVSPLTTSGTLRVDGYLASCYTQVTGHVQAHWAFTPYFTFYHLYTHFWGHRDTHQHIQKHLNSYIHFLLSIQHYFLPNYLQ